MISILTAVPPSGLLELLLPDVFLDVAALPVELEVESDEVDNPLPPEVDADREGLLRLMTGATTVRVEEEEAEVGEVFMDPVNGPLE